MKIQAYSIIAGSVACNACCPYCISKMTPSLGVNLKESQINWRNFNIGCRFAKGNGVTTVLITGKGEPLLFPNQITAYLKNLKDYSFPFIELQTNGMLLFQKQDEYFKYLKEWYNLGLTIIAISIVHYKDERNKEIFQPKGPYMNLVGLIRNLHSIGFSIRLSCIMFKGGIDNVEEVKNLINFAKKNKVEQLSIRPIEMPRESKDLNVAKWVAEHKLDEEIELNNIRDFLKFQGVELMQLIHGAIIYDVDGQNICLTNALTLKPSLKEEIRQLIFFPDGHLRYDWQYPGAILL